MGVHFTSEAGLQIPEDMLFIGGTEAVLAHKIVVCVYIKGVVAQRSCEIGKGKPEIDSGLRTQLAGFQ